MEYTEEQLKAIETNDKNLRIIACAGFIITIQYMLTNLSIEDTLEFFNKYSNDYINRRLPAENYRELNPENMVRMNSPLFSFYVQEVKQSDIENLDISYNYALLRDIGQIVHEKYFSEKMYR